jgi:hypothetical protein
MQQCPAADLRIVPVLETDDYSLLVDDLLRHWPAGGSAAGGAVDWPTLSRFCPSRPVVCAAGAGEGTRPAIGRPRCRQRRSARDDTPTDLDEEFGQRLRAARATGDGAHLPAGVTSRRGVSS